MKENNYKEDYVVQFDSHGERHEVSIDLECFAKAVKPYLDKPAPSPDTCDCGGCVGGCGKCHSQCECKPKDLVEGQIRLLADKWPNDDIHERENFSEDLRGLVKLAREGR